MFDTEALKKRDALDRKNSGGLMKVYFAPQSRCTNCLAVGGNWPTV